VPPKYLRRKRPDPRGRLCRTPVRAVCCRPYVPSFLPRAGYVETGLAPSKIAETRQAASLQDINCVPDANRASRENLRPQSAAVQQALHHPLARYLLQVIARLTQADAANAHFADGELLAHQVIQRDVAGHDVAESVASSQLNLIVAPQRLNRLGFNQREFVIRLGFVERAELESVPVTLKPGAWYRRRLTDRFRRPLSGGSDMNRFHSSVR